MLGKCGKTVLLEDALRSGTEQHCVTVERDAYLVNILVRIGERAGEQNAGGYAMVNCVLDARLVRR